ncbi:MAG: cytochrome c oxidase accessory protein CcoG [Bacteroidetes bacterium RIFCSPLOWO2_12_FULL_35_15]|nr:MAG: cytochrome c oxidase accessory protein CcoG [Bacteroidetes bacterium RIFCSPLOWO2_12_FULL_35_15]
MENNEFKPDESFRDSIATINKQGNRAWIFAKKPKGKFTNRRTIFSIIYLLAFFIVPFIKVNGEPLFLFNVVERKFIIFGGVFWPQDLFLFALAMLTFIVFIVLFTVVFGRIFCGWICPQTIFMDMVFRKIEYWIEGDAGKQKMLDKQPWNAQKIGKKSLKVSVFYLVSFIFSNVFLSYIIGMDEVKKIIMEPISQNLASLISMLLFTFVFFLVYLRFREQVCIVVCPYGRLQGVLLDKNSILVAYDYIRGEPRSKYTKAKDQTKGDCIDCHQCVDVCPTGIDIRNGTQLECINCTACIDACNTMMEAVGYEKNLIRYDSEYGIANKEKLKITPRIKAYSLVLLILVGVLITLLVTRTDVETTIFRTPGMLYQEQPNNRISNLYNIKIINKTRDFKPVKLQSETEGAELIMVGNNPIKVEKENISNGAFFIYMDRDKIKNRKTKLTIGVYSNGEKITTVSTNFLGPISR